MPPHRLRHLLFTWLKTQGIDDALIRPSSGHASRQSLEIYSRLALTDAQTPTIKRSATFRSEDHPSLRLATRSGVPGRPGGRRPAHPARPGRRELGRIAKSLYLLAYLDDETYRRRILTQLNRTESRHALARAVFHGQRGQLRQRYREGQEDQLGALGLVVNAIVRLAALAGQSFSVPPSG